MMEVRIEQAFVGGIYADDLYGGFGIEIAVTDADGSYLRIAGCFEVDFHFFEVIDYHPLSALLDGVECFEGIFYG